MILAPGWIALGAQAAPPFGGFIQDIKKNFPDAGEANEPALQSGEDLANFLKGKGGNPKNNNSVPINGVQLKAPTLGGSGCQSGTVAASLSPDGKTMSILFDDYIALAGKNYGTQRDVKLCTVQVPIEVPAGLQFTVVKLDYRGYNGIPNGARTRYVTMYSFVEQGANKQIGKRIRRQYDFFGPLDEDYIISSDVSAAPVWSTCGTNIVFRLDTRVVAASNKAGEDVMATIDSIDASAATDVQYHLLWRSCGTSPKPPGKQPQPPPVFPPQPIKPPAPPPVKPPVISPQPIKPQPPFISPVKPPPGHNGWSKK